MLGRPRTKVHQEWARSNPTGQGGREGICDVMVVSLSFPLPASSTHNREQLLGTHVQAGIFVKGLGAHLHTSLAVWSPPTKSPPLLEEKFHEHNSLCPVVTRWSHSLHSLFPTAAAAICDGGNGKCNHAPFDGQLPKQSMTWPDLNHHHHHHHDTYYGRASTRLLSFDLLISVVLLFCMGKSSATALCRLWLAIALVKKIMISSPAVKTDSKQVPIGNSPP